MHPLLIASDLDGTLILHTGIDDSNPDDTLAPELFPLLDEMREKGIFFCAATGRRFSSVQDHFGVYASKICCICENGAYIYADGELLEVIPIPRELGREICASLLSLEGCYIRINTTENVYFLVHTEEQADLMRSWEYPEALTAFSFDTVEGEITQITVICTGQIGPYAELLIPMWQDRLRVMVSGLHWLDFSCAGKGIGLRALCRHLGIALERSAALGDNYNDIEMLETAGFPFVMDTAPPELLEKFPFHIHDPHETIRGLISTEET